MVEKMPLYWEISRKVTYEIPLPEPPKVGSAWVVEGSKGSPFPKCHRVISIRRANTAGRLMNPPPPCPLWEVEFDGAFKPGDVLVPLESVVRPSEYIIKVDAPCTVEPGTEVLDARGLTWIVARLDDLKENGFELTLCGRHSRSPQPPFSIVM